MSNKEILEAMEAISDFIDRAGYPEEVKSAALKSLISFYENKLSTETFFVVMKRQLENIFKG